MTPVEPRFFNPYDDLTISERNLPHWEQQNALYFVTFRLADSLPATKIRQWQAERDAWLKQHSEPWTKSDWKEYADLFPERFNQWLDAGSGSCLLAKPEVRLIVEQSLRHFDGDRYRLFDFVIMPNHVHLLVQPLSEEKLLKILHGWKSFTAHAINKQLHRSGTFWQDESYDHLVRNASQLSHYRSYIAANPIKASLKKNEYTVCCEESSTAVPPVLHCMTHCGNTGQSSTAVPAVSGSTGGTPVLHCMAHCGNAGQSSTAVPAVLY